MPSPSSPALDSYVPFADLLVEVFALIAQHLDTRDIQSCRLVGRNLCILSSPYLCQIVTFAPHEENLIRLKKISQNSLISHYAHTLRYDTTILRAPDAPRDALNILEFRDHYTKTPGHPFKWGWTPQNNLLYYANPDVHDEDNYGLSEFVNEQDNILCNLESHLQHIISAFPNLSTVTICNSYWKKSDHIRFKYALRENSISRRWVRPSQIWPLFRVLANTPGCNIRRINIEGYSSSKPYRFLNNVDFANDSHFPGSIKYCLGSAFKTAHYPKENIPFIHGSALSMTTEDVFRTQTAFSNLTQLHIGLYTEVPLERFYVEPADVPKTYWADFPKLLNSLPRVVDLSLDLKVRRSIDQQHTCQYYHDDLEELFSNVQMSQLQKLKLSQFRSRGSSVTDLLLKHPKLKELSLNFIIEIKTDHDVWRAGTWIADPQWVRCVEVMRDLKLQRLSLRGIEGFGHDYHRYGSENEDLTLSRIHDYILYGYGDNPLPTRMPCELNELAWDAQFW